MPETEEEMIERRSRNADAVFIGLAKAWDAWEWFWIIVGGLFLLGAFIFWLVG